MILELVDQAMAKGARLKQAAETIGLTARTLIRWRKQNGGIDRRKGPIGPPANKLDEPERKQILNVANSAVYRDLSPKQIVPLLADEGAYIASESSFYRVLRDYDMVNHRESSKPPQTRRPKEHVATGPGQFWTLIDTTPSIFIVRFVLSPQMIGITDARNKSWPNAMQSIYRPGNEIHRDGFGKNGETNIDFFRHIAITDNIEGNHDLNNDGRADVTAIFKVSGNNSIDASAAIGIRGTLTFAGNNEKETAVPIDYSENDTVFTVIKKINDAKTGVVAYLNHDGEFALKATVSEDNDKKNFMIRHMEDSGQFLVGLTGVLKQSGLQGAFDYRRINDIMKFIPDREHIAITPKYDPASYMAVSEAIIGDVDKIATAQGKDIGGTGDFNKTNGIGDGSNALRIAALRQKNAMVDDNTTFNDFYTSLISKIGTQGEEAGDRVKNQETLLKNLTNLRESISGVNLDEEMANMVTFQHGYNAAARIVSMFDKLLETIIRMGA